MLVKEKNKIFIFFMTKRPELLIIAVVAVVALLGLFLLFSNSITGNSSKRLNVKSIYCHYMDYDAVGDCMSIERQEGTRCNPPQDILDYQRSSVRGSFLRLCKPMYGSDTF